MGRTRQRLLESACEIFAEQGYQAETVAEILSVPKRISPR